MSDEKPTLSDITQRYIRDRDAGAWRRSQEARSFMELLEKNAARERERILSEVPTVISAPNTWTVGGYAPEDTVTLTGRGEATVSAPGGRLDTLQIGMEPDWALGDWVTVPSLPVTGLAEIPVTDEMLGAAFDTCPALGPMGFGDGQVARIYRAMAALAPSEGQHLRERNNLAEIAIDQANRLNEKDREITTLRAERDLWKGLHGDLVAKFRAAVPDPKPASGHNPFREFGGDRRRGGG